MKFYPHGIGILGIALIAGLFLFSSDSYRADDASFNFEYWKQLVETRGGEHAYGQFKKRHAKTPLGERHVAAHSFGRALYEGGGVEAFTVCDTAFEYGCYHGFVTAAIAQGGEPRVRELDRVCVQTFGEMGGGCLHGIGHGVVEYVGYERLSEALLMCDRATTQVAPLLGCTSGAFMEYFSPLVESQDGLLISTSRPIDPDDPLAPCPTLSPEFQTSCYYELGQRLLQGGGTYPNRCADVQGDNRAYCFMGIGEHGTGVEISFEKGVKTCAAFTGADFVSCRAGVAWSLFAAEKDRALIEEACAVEDRARCLTLADMTEGRDPNFPQP